MSTHITILLLLLLSFHNCSSFSINDSNQNEKNKKIIELKFENDVVWIVQLSDLHFSVHHPDRASDFMKFVSSTLSVINPSLVIITGDLTGIVFSFFLC